MKGNNMKKVLFAAIAALPLLTMAISDRPAPEGSDLARQREKMKSRIGPIIAKPGSQKGLFVVVDAQNRVEGTNVEYVATALANRLHFNISYIKVEADVVQGEDWTKLAREHRANAVLAVVDDEKLPGLLVAPDDRWAVVNVRRLESGLKNDAAKERFLAPRTNKQIIRAMGMLGGVNSQFKNSPCAALSLVELDAAGVVMPPDVQQSFGKYLESIGMSAKKYASYRAACREGWAPAPTNEVMQAIWDDVHAIPANPMKIEFDPKKGR
jgi:hypothetical protein